MMREVFDQIAPGWYSFRHWTIFRNELEELRERWQRGKLLNVGCAHGPDFLPFREGFELYGVDFSRKMLKQAQRYALKFDFHANLVQADVSYLPFANEAFDWAISVAAYHHVRGEEGREGALQELYRVLKPGAEAFITVWNRWQPRFWFKGRDIDVPWRMRDSTLYRYYHLFSHLELERLTIKMGFLLLKSFPESSYRFPVKLFSKNICLLVRKES